MRTEQRRMAAGHDQIAGTQQAEDHAGGLATLTVHAASPGATMNTLDQPDAIGLVRQAVTIDPAAPRVLLPAESVSILSGLRRGGPDISHPGSSGDHADIGRKADIIGRFSEAARGTWM